MIVLDTHAWIWWSDDPRRLSTRARRAIDEADAVGVSVFSCYEVARLAARGRLGLQVDSRVWIAQALHMPKVDLLDLSPSIAMAAANLDWPHGDPGDRLIVATAITLKAPLVSKDDKIRLFAPARAIW